MIILFQQVFVTLDPAHMIKLARNALATLRTFKSPTGDISFRYIEDLVKLQDDLGLTFANKVTIKS